MITRLINGLYRIVPVWQPTAVVAVTILFLTLAPQPLGDEPPPMFEGADKVVHALMFGALAGVIALDRFMSGRRDGAIALTLIFSGVALGGGLIEVAQQLMGAGRSGDMADFGADTIGCALGIGVFLLLRRRWG